MNVPVSKEVMDIHKQLVSDIVERQYYVDLLDAAHNKTPKINNHEDLMSLWGDFWWSLPDHPSIRTDLFFRVCDFAEGNYYED